MRRRGELVAMIVLAAACALAAGAPPVHAQLRIVDYNIAQNSQFNSDPSGLNTILAAIAAESVNGIARPIDVMANQELSENGADGAFIVDELNAVYGAGTYAAAPIPGNALTGGNGLPTLIYNTTTVTLLETLAFGNVGEMVNQQPRSTMRYKLRPVGYDAAADFYIYNSHYKSDDNANDKARRLVEATSIRANADALGASAHALYVGDFNIKSSSEDMYVHLLSPGAGQAVDPIDKSEDVNGNPVTWSDNATYKSIHTQGPVVDSDPNWPYFTGQVPGGMDDRFDFQLVTTELTDGEGMSYLGGSYRTFGNNGTHSINQAITTGTGAAANVLAALAEVSDHLPVVVDYQMPAKMQVQVASIPPTVGLGAASSVSVLVQNIASALVAAGADELDYMLSVTGDLIGGAAGVANPLAAANAHQIALNTSTPGLKSGTINVVASSQGAANAIFSMPVSFTVGGGGGVVRTIIARDNFDAPINLSSFMQTPAPGAFTANTRGFQRYQVGVSTVIPVQLRDDSAGSFPPDTLGIINGATTLDGWFGATDTVNPDNPSGDGEATWAFNVAGASALEVSIDMGAMGNFEETGVNRDRFDWTYSMDGGAFQPLFTSSVQDGTMATYTMAGGAMITAPDPAFMTNRANETVQLSNVMQTITSAIPELGSMLTLKLLVRMDGAGSSLPGDGSGEAYAFDNIIVTGLVPSFLESDFDEDGFVDAADLATWTTNFGTASGAEKSSGDADADGDVDGLDFLVWQRQNTLGSAAQVAGAAMPEPGALGLALFGIAFGRSALRCGGPSRCG
jgi:hypothetical protein